ncbi:Protein of unknown function DM4/12 [Trinorchestia longiramus]|nr:Protein of unknown function DM4/12 [Trinorchestia longiramus]
MLSMLWRTTASSDSLEALARRSAENLRINLGDEGQWLKELSDLTKYSSLPAKSRQKRIVPIELPRGLSFELKWNIDFTLYTYARFGMDLQLAILNDMFYPREFGPVQENFSLVELIPDVYKPFVQKPPRLEEEEEEMERRRYQVLHRKKREAHRDREIFYGVLEKYIDEYGMPARPCLLRTICELAEVPLQDDLFGKLVTTIFR